MVHVDIKSCKYLSHQTNIKNFNQYSFLYISELYKGRGMGTKFRASSYSIDNTRDFLNYIYSYTSNYLEKMVDFGPMETVRRPRLRISGTEVHLTESVFAAQQPYIFIGQVLGFPIQYFHDEGTIKSKTNKRSFFQIAVIEIFFGYCLHNEYHLSDAYKIIISPKEFIIFTAYLHMITGIFGQTCLYLSSFLNVALHGDILTHLDEINGIILKAGIAKIDLNMKFRILYWISHQIVMYFCKHMMVFGYSPNSKLHMNVVYVEYFPLCISTTVLMHFSYLVEQANQNLKIVNAELELISQKKLMSKDDAKAVNLHPKKTELRQMDVFRRIVTSERDLLVLERIMVFWRAYDKICDFTGSVNKAYSPNIALVFLVTFGIFVLRIFIICCSVLDVTVIGKNCNIYIVIGTCFLDAAFNIYKLFGTINTCHQCKSLVSIDFLSAPFVDEHGPQERRNNERLVLTNPFLRPPPRTVVRNEKKNSFNEEERKKKITVLLIAGSIHRK